MKILFVTTVSNTVNAFLIPHIKLLVDQGHQVDVAFNIVREVSPELANLGCKVHKIDFQRSPINKRNYLAYKKIKKLVVQEEYDVIHTHTPIASFVTRFACRGIDGLKIIYTAHGFHFYKGASLKSWLLFYPLERFAARYTDATITINQEDFKIAKKLKLRKQGNVYKIHGVGIDLARFSPPTIEQKNELKKTYGLTPEDHVLLYTAELNENKHQELLIKSIKRLSKKFPTIKLLLAGTGNCEESYKNLVEELNLKEHVRFLGYRNDIEKLLKVVDIGVSASRREGLPVNIMEAMASKLPLVVTDCRGNRDLVEHEQNGFVVGLNDDREFANSIEVLLGSEKLRHQFGTESIKNIQKYSINNVLQELEQIYNRILSKR